MCVKKGQQKVYLWIIKKMIWETKPMPMYATFDALYKEQLISNS